LAQQASQFGQFVQACVVIRRCTSFTVWEFTDKYSWVPAVFTGEGAATLYDENFNPKPAYSAVQQTLAAAAGH
jgi:endo-1,4-beta-xylanase